MDYPVFFTPEDIHAYDADKERMAQTELEMQAMVHRLFQEDKHVEELQIKEDARHSDEMQTLQRARAELQQFAIDNPNFANLDHINASGGWNLDRAYEREGDRCDVFLQQRRVAEARRRLERQALSAQYDRMRASLVPTYQPIRHHQEYEYDRDGSVIWRSASDIRNGL